MCKEMARNSLPTAECPVKMSQSKTQKSSIFIHLETLRISVSVECLKCKDVKSRLWSSPVHYKAGNSTHKLWVALSVKLRSGGNS